MYSLTVNQNVLSISLSRVGGQGSAGNTYDGDEVSQGRMARAIIALSTGLALSVA